LGASLRSTAQCHDQDLDVAFDPNVTSPRISDTLQVG
jgi:hypothetical protein